MRLDDTVRIEVFDTEGVSAPEQRDCRSDAEAGRGLNLIAALSNGWGWSPAPGGKVVWCEIGVPLSQRRTATGHNRPPADASVSHTGAA